MSSQNMADGKHSNQLLRAAEEVSKLSVGAGEGSVEMNTCNMEFP